MEMEFDLHPDDAVKLPRLKALIPALASRTRAQPFRTVWHDTPDHSLAKQGLALAHQKAGWRLERLDPRHEPWMPAQPPPCVETAESLEDLQHPLPAPLSPAAAVERRQVTFALLRDGGPVSVTLVRGVLRAVEAEHPVSRISLDGADGAVRDLVLTLSESLRLSVPRASLAGEAMAIAQGIAPPARRLGAPALPHGQDQKPSVPAAFSYAIGHLTDVMLHHAPFAAGGLSGPEPVHQMRVAVRRARSVIAVFHDIVGCPAVDHANQLLKALGGQLGPTRDWDVFATETAPQVAAAFQANNRLERLIAASERRRHACHIALETYLGSPAFRATGIELAWLASSNSWHADLKQQEQPAMELDAFAARVLQRRWKKLLSAGKAIEELDIPALHGLRLRAKRLRYAVEIFASLHHSKGPARFIRRLSQLQQALGVLNDGAVAAQLLDQLGGPGGRHGHAIGIVQGFTAGGATNTRAAILRAWERFRSQPAFWS